MYQVIDKYMTFTSAQEECREYGGHLAHVTSVREQVFLEDYIRVNTGYFHIVLYSWLSHHVVYDLIFTRTYI